MNGIAVVIPCFDLGRTLAEAVDSALSQTRPAEEIVVVDDGSTDPETLRVLRLLQRPRARVVSIPHAGVAAARHHGVSLTRSPAIVLLDADDVLDPRYLEKLGARLDEGLDFVSCAVQAFEGAAYVWKPPPLTPVDCLTRGSVHVSTMMRRTLYEAVGGFDPELPAYEDLDFWLHALKRGFRGAVLDEPLLYYRVRADSRYRRGLEPETYADAMRRIVERHRDVVEATGVEVLARKEEFLVELRTYQASLLGELDARPLPWAREFQLILTDRPSLLRGRVLALADAPRVLDPFPVLPQASVPAPCDTMVLVATRPFDESALARACETLPPGGRLLLVALARSDESRLRRALAERFPTDAFEVEAFETLILATARVSGGACAPRPLLPSPTGHAPQASGGLILSWHRIADLDPDTHQLCVTPARFRAQIAMLRESFTVMPLVEMQQAARAGALPANAVALTFDDGYLDALTAAAPILEGLPATFFVNTERLSEAHEAWHDEIERLFPLQEQRMAEHARVMPLGVAARGTLLDGWWSTSGLDRTPRDERRLLLREEILRLSRLPGCEIGSHSANHLQMPRHPPGTQREEVRRAKEELEALLDRTVPAFAYPFGEFDAATVRAVRDAGHLAAVTVEPGFVTADSDPFLLPRIEVGDCEARELWTALREVRRPEPWRATRDRAYAENARLSREETSAGAVRLRSQPPFVIIDPTSRCNARCVMCPVSFRAPGDKGRDMPPALLEQLTPLMTTASHVNLFSSGEPTIAGGILDLLRDARRLVPSDTPVWISTNGKRLTPDLLDLLSAPNVTLQFSVDGGTPEVFETVRRGVRFAELRASLAAVRDRRGSLPYPRLAFSTTLSKRNLHDLAAIFDLAREFGVWHVNFYEEDPEVPEEEAFALDEADRPVFEAQLPRILASGVSFSNGLVFRGRDGLRAVEPAPPADPPVLRCNAPWKVFHARADGSVRPCCTLRTSMGDLNKQSVEEIWNGAEYTKLRRAFVEQRGIPGICYRCTDPLRTLA